MPDSIASYACPVCRGTRTAPVIFGLPGSEALERAERGEVILGGCVIDLEDNRERRGCLECGARWSGSPDATAARAGGQA